MKKGYIAGKLFKIADQRQRIYEKETLAEEVKSVEFFNPLTDNPANDKSKLPTAKDIFIGDTKRVMESNYIVAELDDEDSGTMMELGIAYGINLVLNTINSHLDRGLASETAIKITSMQFPKKEILAHLSDLRVGTNGEYDGKYVPFGVNQYVVGGIELSGKIFPTFEDIVEYLKKKEIGEC